MKDIILNNRYRLLERIGSGGMAVVYRGTDTLLQRRVAIKILRDEFASDPAFLARFQREAQAAANLDHPNIVTVHDVGQDGNRHYIVMEYVEGQDLKTLIRQRGRLGIAEALDITTKICAGVGHAHEAGVIHCDVKPQNVLVTQDGRVKVTDFGIARALSESGLTESDTVWGSPLYLSPEQAAGEPPTPASDVYSIGVITYEMLAGAPPFQAEKPTALALMHLREEPAQLTVHNPQVPPKLAWIVHKTLSKEPAARYRTAEQLAHTLQEYRQHGEQVTGWQPAVPHSSLTTTPQPHPGSDYAAKPQAPSSGLTWLLGVIAMIAVVGLIPLWWLVYQSYASLPALPSSSTPTPLVTLTPESQLVSVPNVMERHVDEAREMVREAGLRLEVTEERAEPDIEGDVVIEQRPAPGESVPPDSTVSVVVNSGGRELAMPDVVGYPVDMVQDGLESDGLQVNVKEVWSTEKEGQVIAQEPESEAAIYAGDSVTLTVSGGVDVPIPLEANLNDMILLKSAELRQDTFKPGGMIGVTLRWQALRSIDTHYVVFVHLLDSEGHLVAQQDGEPNPHTAMWTPEVETVDPRQFTIPTDQPAGRYQLRTGMYPQGRPGARLPVVEAGRTTAESNSILIAEIEIKP